MRAPWWLLAALCAGCGAGTPAASGDQRTPPAAAEISTAVAPPAGRTTFVIVPQDSRVSYHATEEFFAGAMKLLGIRAGRAAVVGATRSIEGQFAFDPARPAEAPGDNHFVVRVNTLVSDQTKRDDYLREIRDDGPSFDAYPMAAFKATSITLRDAGGDAGAIRFTLKGDLTVREITRPVAFDVESRMANEALHGVATARVLLSDFNIGPIAFADILSVADPIEIEVVFTARPRRD
jgi:polyisoprenoid-binding protein YceI